MKNTSFSSSQIGGPFCLILAFLLLISGKCNTNKQINIFSWCGTIIDGNVNNHVLLSTTLLYGDYYYTLSRSGSFTSTNVLITYGGGAWNPGISGHLLVGGGFPGQNVATFSCDIPIGTPCNATETFVPFAAENIFSASGAPFIERTVSIMLPSASALFLPLT